MKRGVNVGIAVLAVVVAGCSSSSSGGSATPPETPSASPSSGATDLPLTVEAQSELIHAYAQMERLPDSAYTGFYKHTAYYAIDNETGIYWAGGSLIPSHSSTRAQVSVQDDGGYLLFEKKPGEAWQLWAVGVVGPPEGLPCPVVPPADVLTVWQWQEHTCNPYMKPPPDTPSPTSAAGATNLTLDPATRQALVEAKAAEAKVPSSGYTGLAKGSAYYAIDNETGLYWAGASVVPSQHNIRAQVSSQDEGGYNIFEKGSDGVWKVYDAGLDGPNPRKGAQCPIQIPADVLAVWHWAPNTCDPPTHFSG